MISDFNSTTRYRRRKETEKALQFIHGEATGSYYGVWDYIAANSPKELIDEFVSGYNRGKYLQETLGKAMKEFQSSSESIKHAVAMKYQNFLSRRKFNLPLTLMERMRFGFPEICNVWELISDFLRQ